MSSAPWRLCLLVVAVMLATLQTAVVAQELVRTFESVNCRYKLPGNDWSWGEQKGTTLFMATHPNGYVVVLSYATRPASASLNQRFVDGFEQSFYQNNTEKLTKRGGRFITLQARPCYQAEATLEDGRTFVNLVLLDRGYSYNLGVLGNDRPVEQVPEFQDIINGFEFTVPPANEAPAPPEENQTISHHMGRVVAYCLAGIVLIVVLRRVFRKKVRTKT